MQYALFDSVLCYVYITDNTFMFPMIASREFSLLLESTTHQERKMNVHLSFNTKV